MNEFKKNNANEHCTTVDLGIVEVNPQKIIALNLEYDDIKNDHKMKKLKKSVKAKGWTNENPQLSSNFQTVT